MTGINAHGSIHAVYPNAISFIDEQGAIEASTPIFWGGHAYELIEAFHWFSDCCFIPRPLHDPRRLHRRSLTLPAHFGLPGSLYGGISSFFHLPKMTLRSASFQFSCTFKPGRQTLGS